jgi:hypothetical protein
MTETAQGTEKTRKANTPLHKQPIGKQLITVENTLKRCGDKSRQKQILQFLLDSYE